MDYSKKTKQYWRKQIKHRGVIALGGKCQICGGIFEDCCYDFHHIIPETKSFTIAGGNINGAKAWLRIRDELKKCTLLCANCHRLLHGGFVQLNSLISPFNDDYYEWDLCQAKAVNTDTGKPIPVRTICPICGGTKASNAHECAKCTPAQKRHFEVNRDELKEMIYTLPFTQIGKNFGVSDNAIRKRCKLFGLPTKKSEIKQYSKEEWNKI